MTNKPNITFAILLSASILHVQTENSSSKNESQAHVIPTETQKPGFFRRAINCLISSQNNQKENNQKENNQLQQQTSALTSTSESQAPAIPKKEPENSALTQPTSPPIAPPKRTSTATRSISKNSKNESQAPAIPKEQDSETQKPGFFKRAINCLISSQNNQKENNQLQQQTSALTSTSESQAPAIPKKAPGNPALTEKTSPPKKLPNRTSTATRSRTRNRIKSSSHNSNSTNMTTRSNSGNSKSITATYYNKANNANNIVISEENKRTFSIKGKTLFENNKLVGTIYNKAQLEKINKFLNS